MNSTQNLQSELSQFIGTEKLYRITHRHVLTDGTKYLAEQAIENYQIHDNHFARHALSDQATDWRMQAWQKWTKQRASASAQAV